MRVFRFKARRRVRRMKEAARLEQLTVAAVVLQAMWRARAHRRFARAQKARVIRCQAIARGFLARRRFAKLQQSVLLVQRAFRARLAGRRARQQYLDQKNAAIRIQIFWRRYRDHKMAELRREAAAIVLQRKFRATMLSISERKRFMQKKKGTLIANFFLAFRK